jgi:hypothetical protein
MLKVSSATASVLVLLIVAALIAVYFGHRSRTSVDDAPAAASKSALDIRKSETATSAAREAAPPASIAVTPKDAGEIFHSLQLCAFASRELAFTKWLSDCKQYEGQPQFQELYARCLNGWMNVANRKAAAEAALKEAGCGDTTDVEARYFEATKQAAKAGETDAQMCYLQGNLGTSREVPLFTDADLEEYKRVAPLYVDAALRRGDWRIVELMTKRSFHPGAGPVTQIPNIGKKETIYKMTKLLRLGATGAYAKNLDADLDGMIHPDLVPEAALPADVVKQGDAWAQETFNQTFSGVAGLTERPTVCGPGRGQPGSLADPPGPWPGG